MKRGTLVLLALLCFAPLLAAEDAALLSEAQAGKAEAQLKLGQQLLVSKPREAASWITKAAEQDYLPAQDTLGSLYRSGQGVEKDFKKAYEWYSKAALRGDANAEFNLGTMYYNGDGVATDYDSAAAWLTLAAESGETSAADALEHTEQSSRQRAPYELYCMFDKGAGVIHDPDRARAYLERAAAADPKLRFTMCKAYLEGRLGPVAPEKAVQVCEDAGRTGHFIELYLAIEFLEGTHIPRDIDRARGYLERAAHGHELDAIYDLGVYHKEANDRVEAYSYFLAADSVRNKYSASLTTFTPPLTKDEMKKGRKQAQSWLDHNGYNRTKLLPELSKLTKAQLNSVIKLRDLVRDGDKLVRVQTSSVCRVPFPPED